MASADGPAHLVSKSSTVPAQPESRAGDPPALYARAEACDKQWAQQMSSNTAHKHIERQSCKLRKLPTEESARHTCICRGSR